MEEAPCFCLSSSSSSFCCVFYFVTSSCSPGLMLSFLSVCARHNACSLYTVACRSPLSPSLISLSLLPLSHCSTPCCRRSSTWAHRVQSGALFTLPPEACRGICCNPRSALQLPFLPAMSGRRHSSPPRQPALTSQISTQPRGRRSPSCSPSCSPSRSPARSSRLLQAPRRTLTDGASSLGCALSSQRRCGFPWSRPL